MPDLTSATIISRSTEMLAADVDGEMVLMSLERGFYYGLAGTARRIWDLLEVPLAFGELCSRLEAQYAGSRSLIDADVRKFLAELTSETIVTLS